MKTIVAGSRNFTNYPYLDIVLGEFDISEIVCGLAKGADLLGKQYALENGIKVKEFPADWKKYGKSAGFKRNKQMGDYAEFLIAFWDGESKGTKQMIDYMKKLQKPVIIKHF